MALLDTYGDIDGMKWDDLVIRFEWTFELQRILENSTLEDDIKKVIEEAGKKMKFSFNEAMVLDWKSNLIASDYDEGLYETFEKYVYTPKHYREY